MVVRLCRSGTQVALVVLSLLTPLSVSAGGGHDDPPAAQPTPAATASPPPMGKQPDPIPTEPWRPNDKRRTLRSYGTNLVRNFAGVCKPAQNGHSLLVTVALTAPSFAVDDDVVDYFERHRHQTFGRIGAQMGGGAAVVGLTIGLFSSGRYAHNDRFRAATYDVSQAVIINQVYTYALKLAIHRQRPDGSNRQSFPSGHSSNAFTIAAVAAHHYPVLAVPSYAAATLVAVSRLAATKHHFSDIVAGAGLGYGVGKVVVHRNGRPPDTPPTKSLSIGPDGGPAGDGRGAALRLQW